MFDSIEMKLDFKDLSNMKHSLETYIEDLERQNFGDQNKEEIEENRDLLSRINKQLKEMDQ